MGKVFPGTTVGEEVKNRVEYLPHVGFSWPADLPDRNERSNKLPLGVGQVGCVGFAGFGLLFHRSCLRKMVPVKKFAEEIT